MDGILFIRICAITLVHGLTEEPAVLIFLYEIKGAPVDHAIVLQQQE